MLPRFATVGRGDAFDVESPDQHRHHHLHLEKRQVAPRTQARPGAERHHHAFRRSCRNTGQPTARIESLRIGEAPLIGRAGAHQAHDERTGRHFQLAQLCIPNRLEHQDRRDRLEAHGLVDARIDVRQRREVLVFPEILSGKLLARATQRFGIGPVAIVAMLLSAVGNAFIPLAPAGLPLIAIGCLVIQQLVADSAATSAA